MDNAQDESALAPQLITVFGLGCGAMSNIYGPMARQITDDLAGALDAFDGLIARAHHLVDDIVVDPNLAARDDADDEVAADDVMPARIRFIVFSSLPADSVVGRLTRELGGRLALSGRLVVERHDVDLALNLWDVGPPNLLWTQALFCAPDELPEVLAGAVGHLGHSLGVAERDPATQRAQASIGTRSFSALQALAAATDHLRRAQLDPRSGPPQTSIAQALCEAIRLDPDYAKPRKILLEHSIDRFRAGDTAYAEALREELQTVRPRRLEYDLMVFESLLISDKRTDAAAYLADVERTFPDAGAALEGARARLR